MINKYGMILSTVSQLADIVLLIQRVYCIIICEFVQDKDNQQELKDNRDSK